MVDFAKIQEMFKTLVTDPKAALHMALLEENQAEVKALTGLGLAIGILGGMGAGPIAAVLTTLIGFLGGVAAVWLGGKLTGGSGSFLAIAMLMGFLQIPMGIVATIGALTGLGFLAQIFSAVVFYFVLVVGHGFSGFKDVAFAWAVAFAVQLLAIGSISAMLVRTFR